MLCDLVFVRWSPINSYTLLCLYFYVASDKMCELAHQKTSMAVRVKWRDRNL